MNHTQFPLQLKFNVATFHNDFTIKDANETTLAYVKQKMFKFRESVDVFTDESQSQLKYNIKANKWLDFSAAYLFTDANGRETGSVVREGWASLWKARYDILDENKNNDLFISEDNAWVKIFDTLFSDIPVLGVFTGYVFNPSYTVRRPDGTEVARLIKEPSLLGRKFSVEKLADFESGEEERIMLSLMMMILLERRRG